MRDRRRRCWSSRMTGGCSRRLREAVGRGRRGSAGRRRRSMAAIGPGGRRSPTAGRWRRELATPGAQSRPAGSPAAAARAVRTASIRGGHGRRRPRPVRGTSGADARDSPARQAVQGRLSRQRRPRRRRPDPAGPAQEPAGAGPRRPRRRRELRGAAACHERAGGRGRGAGRRPRTPGWTWRSERHDDRSEGDWRAPDAVRIGLTGPIGCGKSTVAAHLASRAPSSSMRTSSPATSPSPASRRSPPSCDRFGDGVARPRTARWIVRRSAGSCSPIRPRSRDLEAIVHPAVRPRIVRAARGGGGHRRPAVVLEAIRLVEGGLAATVRRGLAGRLLRRYPARRLAARGRDPADAERRIAAQAGLVARCARPRPGSST